MKRAMALATRVECDEESDGFGGKSDGNKGARRLTAKRAMVTVTATTWVMATVMRLVGDKEGKGEGGKGDGDGDEGAGGRRRGNGDGGKSGDNGVNGDRRAMAMVTKRVMVTATRVGEVGGRQNGQWRWRQEQWRRRQGWRASNSSQWRGWQAIDSDKGNGNGDGDDVDDGEGDEACGRRSGQG
jgi:hypothetical protein